MKKKLWAVLVAFVALTVFATAGFPGHDEKSHIVS